MDLEKDKDQMWFSGGFDSNDHEVPIIGPTEINPSDYIDMTPLGNTLEFVPNFASNASDEERSGKDWIRQKKWLVIYYKKSMARDPLLILI